MIEIAAPWIDGLTSKLKAASVVAAAKSGGGTARGGRPPLKRQNARSGGPPAAKRPKSGPSSGPVRNLFRTFQRELFGCIARKSTGNSCNILLALYPGGSGSIGKAAVVAAEDSENPSDSSDCVLVAGGTDPLRALLDGPPNPLAPSPAAAGRPHRARRPTDKAAKS
jgi:hypothetical protein